jgi:phosphoglycolate phosphatase
MNIFFDLDGTLIDSKNRLYKLFQHLVSESTLSFDSYWDFKRNKINHKTILTSHFNYSETLVKEFEERWMEKIEMSEWLKLDEPFEGVAEFLEQLSKQNDLYIVTARQFESNALQQIESFGWQKFFLKIFVTQQKQEKYELINNAITINKNDWFVGDTGKDIQTGKQLGIRTAAVLSGFLNENMLRQYEPDVIVNEVIDLNLA